jgi:heme exporter protein D
MNWSGWQQFFAMGGYALYVWGAFAMTALVIAFELIGLGVRRRAIARVDEMPSFGVPADDA